MRNLVFFPGRYSLEDLGATTVVARNIFPHAPRELEGTVIGMGNWVKQEHCGSNFTQVNLLSEYRSRSKPYRAVEKLRSRLLPKGRVGETLKLWLEHKLSTIADELAASHLRNLVRSDPAIDLVMGYVGESFAFGQTAIAQGRKYIVHSQFCHPVVQRRLVDQAYEEEGLRTPSWSEVRMRRQLATLELADLIWCPSEFVQRSLVEEGVPIGKTFVSPLGVDTDRIKRGVRSVEKSGEFHILFVGNVGLQKGIHVLLRALQAARITNAVLILNGQPDPAARDLLLEFTPHLEAKRIVIRIDPGDPRRHLPNADLFVLPSVHDSYGIVVVEAMTAGLPIVVSSNVGAREILKHGKNALVFQSGDYTGLSDCLSQLHDQPDRRSTLGRAAQEESGKYDARITAARLAKRLAAE